MRQAQKIRILRDVEKKFFASGEKRDVSDGKLYVDSGLDMAYWLSALETKADEEGYDIEDETTLRAMAQFV